MKEINLNHEHVINVDKLDYGTNDIKDYYVRITKNAIDAFLEVKVKKNNHKEAIGWAFIKNNIFINEDLILNIEKIGKAQRIVRDYQKYLCE